MDTPTLEIEMALRAQGHQFIAGLDEAGRGALAGPVVASAVILPVDRPDLSRALAGVRDSKQLSPRAREGFFDVVHQIALGIGVGVIAPVVVDRDGVVAATRRAMRRSLARISPQPSFLILDYLRLASIPLPQVSFPKADARCLSVAAASIVAKVSRDRLMCLLDERYPGYGFARHNGYGTTAHRAALDALGPTPIHRLTFAPLNTMAVDPTGT